jgi:glycosyltransferase 2 family protein
MRPGPIWTWARWAIGVAVVAALVLQLDAGAVVQRLGAVDLALAVPAIVGLVGVHLLGALTWRLLLAAFGATPLPWPALVRHYYVAQAIGGVTPANLGADAYRFFALRGEQAGWRRTGLPIVVQRATSSAALSLIGVAGLLLLPPSAGVAAWIVSGALAIGLVSSGVIIWVQVRGRRGRPSSADDPIGDASTSATIRATATAFGLGLAFHVVSLFFSYLLVRSVTSDGDPAQLIGALAVARLSILIPFSPSGLGFQEGALALLFVTIGLPAEVAIAALLLNRIALLVTSLLGIGLLLASRRSAAMPAATSRERATRPATQ